MAAMVFVGLACACPNISEWQDTIGTVGAALTEMPGMLTELPGVLSDLPATIEAGMETPGGGLTGIIRGHLSYPSEFLPAQRIVAFEVATMEAAGEVTTLEGQSEYALIVPAGDYYVVAYLPDGTYSAGYSQAVPCGLLASCTDHSLIPVHVEPGAVVEDIDPQDWYAPEGAFPEMP